ncbi:MAG: LLM class flavin-dependent oxidoreductase, partial [Acidimicrobiales bacterium]
MAEPRYWMMLPASRSAKDTAAVARRAEEQGLEGVFSIQLASNPWLPLGPAALATSTLRVATGIALGFTRSPVETAFAALDADHLSEGRFTLGLGTSVRRANEDHYGVGYEQPVARLEEAITLIKAVLSGQGRTLGRFDGDFYHVDLTTLAHKPPFRPNLPVWVAALRTPLVRLAGRCADGLIGHPSWSVPWTVQQVNGPYAEALAASGRQRDQVEVNLWSVVAPNPDVAESVHDAKSHVANYASIAQYEPYFAAHGFGEVARKLQTAVAERQRNTAELIPDEMARTFVLCGTPDQVRQQLQPLWEVADSICLQPPPLRADARAAYDARIAALTAA